MKLDILGILMSLAVLSYILVYNMDKLYDKKLLRNAMIVGIIASFALLFNWEYGMYFFGNLIIFWVDFYMVCYLYKHVFEKNKNRIFVLVVMMILVNPIFPIPFQKLTWQVIDVLSGIILIILYLILNKDQKFFTQIKNALGYKWKS